MAARARDTPGGAGAEPVARLIGDEPALLSSIEVGESVNMTNACCDPSGNESRVVGVGNSAIAGTGITALRQFRAAAAG